MTTTLAILADIHGNLPAFEAVQADIAAIEPDQVIVNGDIVNRGPQSLDCLEAVRATGWPVIYGNHEDYAVKRRERGFPPEWGAPFFDPFQQVADSLNDEQDAYLRSLPTFRVVDLPGLPALHITHGSPRALNDGLGPWLDDAAVVERLDMIAEPVLIGAHTHRPFDRRIGERWVLNTSAVGVPYNGNPHAQYLLLTGEDGAWHATFRRVAYDRGLVYAAYESNGAMDYVINHVFKHEIETATFHLGSYIRFCKAHDLEQDSMGNFKRYCATTAHVVPGRSLKPSASHPNGEGGGPHATR